MITAIDTNVLVDVLMAYSRFGPASARAMRACADRGALIVCEVVLAETAAGIEDAAELGDALGELGIRFVPANEETATWAGATWQRYRRQGGRRDRIIADFLVGAHARMRADRLLTRDRGFFRAYFDELVVLDPGQS